MAHDVFISHAHKDKGFANVICEKLESSQLKCWMAGRDISAGDDWSEAIRDAIGSSRVILVLLSENANAATHLEREIAHAYYVKRPIVPVRLTSAPPRREFLFYFGNTRWFDAFNPPLDQSIAALTASVNSMVQGCTVARDQARSYRADGASYALEYEDSHRRGLGLLLGAAILGILSCAAWLLWSVFSQEGEGLPLANTHPTQSSPAASPDLTLRAPEARSSLPPAYTFTPSVSPTPLGQDGAARALPSPVAPVEASVSTLPGIDPNASGKTPRSKADDGLNAKAAQEPTPAINNQPTPVVEGASPTKQNDPAATQSVPERLARFNPSPAATGSVAPLAQSSPSVESVEAQVQTNSRPASDEESLKKLVQDYMQTMRGDADVSQARFFAGRVNFYGKGVLSFAEVHALMDRYRREWPSQNWVPRGEPEFPKDLHSTHPELYVVIQPFDWTLANGSEHKKGSASLYVRIRKDAQGQFHIIFLRSTSTPESH